jgi:hypothetical protein
MIILAMNVLNQYAIDYNNNINGLKETFLVRKFSFLAHLPFL